MFADLTHVRCGRGFEQAYGAPAPGTYEYGWAILHPGVELHAKLADEPCEDHESLQI